MKLYEVNQAIVDLIDSAIDPETGEVLVDPDAMTEQLNGLQMERKRILEYLAKLVLNTRSDIAALKDEEARLKARRERLAKKEDHLMGILDRECGGEKTDLGVATLSYRKASHVEVKDSTKAINWFKRHKLKECYRVPAPEVSKTEVKKLITSGTKVPGCEVVENQSCTLK